jgi:hypothetical protein
MYDVDLNWYWDLFAQMTGMTNYNHNREHLSTGSFLKPFLNSFFVLSSVFCLGAPSSDLSGRLVLRAPLTAAGELLPICGSFFWFVWQTRSPGSSNCCRRAPSDLRLLLRSGSNRLTIGTHGGTLSTRCGHSQGVVLTSILTSIITSGWHNRKHRPSYCLGLSFLVTMHASSILGESSVSMEVCSTCRCLATTAFAQTRHNTNNSKYSRHRSLFSYELVDVLNIDVVHCSESFALSTVLHGSQNRREQQKWYENYIALFSTDKPLTRRELA